MSVALRPYFDPLAEAYGIGKYFKRNQLTDLKLDREAYEVLCTDGLHYFIIIKSFDSASLLGHLCFNHWGKKYDYVGPFDDLYITNKGTYSTGIARQNFYPNTHINRFYYLANELNTAYQAMMLEHGGRPTAAAVDDDGISYYSSSVTPSKEPRRTTVLGDDTIIALDDDQNDASTITSNEKDHVTDEEWSNKWKKKKSSSGNSVKSSGTKSKSKSHHSHTTSTGSTKKSSRSSVPTRKVSVSNAVSTQSHSATATESQQRQRYYRPTNPQLPTTTAANPLLTKSQQGSGSSVVLSMMASSKHGSSSAPPPTSIVNQQQVSASSTTHPTSTKPHTKTDDSDILTFYYKSSSTGRITKIVLSKRSNGVKDTTSTNVGEKSNVNVTAAKSRPPLFEQPLITATPPRGGTGLGTSQPTTTNTLQQQQQRGQLQQSQLLLQAAASHRSASDSVHRPLSTKIVPTHSTSSTHSVASHKPSRAPIENQRLQSTNYSITTPSRSHISSSHSISHSSVKSSHSKGKTQSIDRYRKQQKMQRRDYSHRDNDDEIRSSDDADDDDDDDSVSIQIGDKVRRSSVMTISINNSQEDATMTRTAAATNKPAIGRFQFFPRNTPKSQIVPVTELLKSPTKNDNNSNLNTSSSSSSSSEEEEEEAIPVVDVFWGGGADGKKKTKYGSYLEMEEQQHQHQHQLQEQHRDRDEQEDESMRERSRPQSNRVTNSNSSVGATTPRGMFTSSLIEDVEDDDDHEENVDDYFQPSQSQPKRRGRPPKNAAITTTTTRPSAPTTPRRSNPLGTMATSTTTTSRSKPKSSASSVTSRSSNVSSKSQQQRKQQQKQKQTKKKSNGNKKKSKKRKYALSSSDESESESESMSDYGSLDEDSYDDSYEYHAEHENEQVVYGDSDHMVMMEEPIAEYSYADHQDNYYREETSAVTSGHHNGNHKKNKGKNTKAVTKEMSSSSTGGDTTMVTSMTTTTTTTTAAVIDSNGNSTGNVTNAVPTHSDFLLWNNIIHHLFLNNKPTTATATNTQALMNHIKYDFETRDSVFEHLKFLLQTKYDEFDIAFAPPSPSDAIINGIDSGKDAIANEHSIFQVPIDSRRDGGRLVGGDDSTISQYGGRGNKNGDAQHHPIVNQVIAELKLDRLVDKSKHLLSIFIEADQKKRHLMNEEERVAMELCVDVLEVMLKANNKLRNSSSNGNSNGFHG